MWLDRCASHLGRAEWQVGMLSVLCFVSDSTSGAATPVGKDV